MNSNPEYENPSPNRSNTLKRSLKSWMFRPSMTGIIILMILLSAGCSRSEKNFINPEKAYPALFKDVELNQVFPDDKTFPDCIPQRKPWEIRFRYRIWKHFHSPNDLKKFVEENFKLPTSLVHPTHLEGTINEHLKRVLDALIVDKDKQPRNSSLIPLPYNFVIPGGRFRETYYWDTYFTLLGYAALHQDKVVYRMTENMAYLIDKFGFIPNGNRSYYLSRSQPPFFSLMVDLDARLFSDTMYVHFLPELTREYAFWMKNSPENIPVYRHTVHLDDSAVLNRYYDALNQPRTEMYRADYRMYHDHKNLISDTLRYYRNIRSTAESGWDFSSRWMTQGTRLESTATLNILPVDLNCLLYHLEKTIARALTLKNSPRSIIFNRLAGKRKEYINRYFWNDTAGYYFDYNFREGKQTHKYTLAGIFPLFMNIADPDKAARVARVIRKDFLKPGGVVTTLVHSGQQWDAPNGWAPLEWITIKALGNYHINGLSDTIKNRWLHLNERYFDKNQKMVEKYDVTDTSVTATGGEYPTQDGFGWTNGVYLDLTTE